MGLKRGRLIWTPLKNEASLLKLSVKKRELKEIGRSEGRLREKIILKYFLKD